MPPFPLVGHRKKPSNASGEFMIRRALLLLSLAAVYIVIKNNRKPPDQADHLDEAQWANEGGANAPASV